MKSNLTYSIIVGAKKGWKGFVWILKIIVPVSLFTVLIEYSGLINKISYILTPSMSILNLPAIAAIPLIAGMLVGIYAGIASMSALPLSIDQMTLIAIFLLISHSLIQEGIIQGKSGLSPFKATLIRLGTSLFAVVLSSQFITPESKGTLTSMVAISSKQPLYSMIKTWLISISYISAKIFIIITIVMIILEVMKTLDLMKPIVSVLNPFLKILGLNSRVGILWLTAASFGIIYGAAAIVEEAKEKSFTKEELEKLHISIGINHSMIEDPVLFLSLGLNPFLLFIIRLIISIVAVQIYVCYQSIKRAKDPMQSKK